MRQRRWLELLKDYDCTIEYHSGKANVVADALGRKVSGRVANLLALRKMNVDVQVSPDGVLLATLKIRPVLHERESDKHKIGRIILLSLERRWIKEKGKEFVIHVDGALMLGNWIYVPKVDDLRREILDEAHSAPYAMHPGSSKMYQMLKGHFWWPKMKKEVAEFVSKCMTCQQIKSEHQAPVGKLHPLSIPEWKWEKITMDFVTGLPQTQRKNDAIWVIVDRLTKSAHFLPIRWGCTLDQLAKRYVDEIVRLHGVPLSIVSERDPRFTSRFWGSLQQALGTKLHFSTAFHP